MLAATEYTQHDYWHPSTKCVFFSFLSILKITKREREREREENRRKRETPVYKNGENKQISIVAVIIFLFFLRKFYVFPL